jgi:hypothetical protein
MRCVLDLGRGSPGCWQRWLHCWRVASGISQGICWSITRWVDWSIGYSVSSGISRLHYFVFASPFFSHQVEGTLATMSLSRAL